MKRIQPGWLYMLDMTTAIVLFAVAYCIVEIALHFRDEPRFAGNVALILLMLSPIIAFVIAKRVKRVEGQFFEVGQKRVGGVAAYEQVGTTTTSCLAVTLGINVLFGLVAGLTNYQLQPIETYLFYGAIAVGEEITFRVALMSVAIYALAFMTSNIHIQVIIASLLSAIVFTVAHLGVYGGMPIHLGSVFCAGLAMALFYGYTKNPLPNIVAHFITNMIAAGFVFTSSII